MQQTELGSLLVTAVFAVVLVSCPTPTLVAQNSGAQKTFATPDEAARALLAAAEADDMATLRRLFGPGGKTIIDSEDPVQDKTRRAGFVRRAKRLLSVQADSSDPMRATILVGEEETPFPVPVVNTDGRWRFDSEQGKKELLARRIGANELDAIALCAVYVEAQFEFAAGNQDRSGVSQYAQQVLSTPGQKNGLYWEQDDSDPASPIGVFVKEAQAEGYDISGTKPIPYHGYYYHILTRQGSNAPEGKREYLVHGMMIGGFAMIAWPAEYGVTGIKSFIVNQSGVVYEKDLGTETIALAKAITTFNPDRTWRPVK